MASSGSIWVSLGLKTDQFSKGVNKAQGNLKGFKKSTSTLSTSMKSLGVAMAGAFAFSAVKGFFTSSLSAYDEQIQAQRKLENALGFTSTALQSQASALQKTTKFGDEATLQMQAQLATMGLTEKQIFKLTPLVQDLSAQTGKSLAKSAKEVTSALATGSTTLEKYGVSLSASNTQAENFDITVAGLQQSVGGAAAVMAKEGLGSAEQLDNAYGDIKESVGKLITEGLEPLIPALTASVETFGLLVDDKNLSFFEKMIGVFNPAAAGLMGLNKEFERTIRASSDLQSLSANTKKAFKDVSTQFLEGKITLEGFKRQIKDLKRTSLELHASYSSLDDSGKAVVATTTELTEAQKKAAAAAAQLRKRNEENALGFDKVQNKTLELNEALAKIKPEPIQLEIAAPKQETWQEMAAQFKVGTDQLNINALGQNVDVLSQKADNAAMITGAAFGAMSNGIISNFGTANSAMEGFAGTMGAMVIDILAQTLAVATGNAIAAATGAATVAGPFAPAVLPATIATMVGTTVSAFAAIPAFANGGLVTGPTMGLVGEGKGTTSMNPEVIAPLDKLQGMIGGSGGDMSSVKFRIEGTDLVGVLNRTNKSSKFSS